ncbi:YbjN domain-containing protein [Porphyrobacter sp. GA68]|uniref:YbjN domain-containing protein n=1 Tax=Porphyrobacter sp. GA68 TaxID=2883480 RepID=UPI001D18A5DD|nr:YbjN domain-containing protein [Porphyrobacter sp. GA68]
MSAAAAIDLFEEGASALLVFRALFEARGWTCRAASLEEVVGDVAASWGTYQLRFVRRRDDRVMQAICRPDITVTDCKVGVVSRLIALVNEQIWLGHFDLWSRGNVLVFRHAIVLGDEGEISLSQAQLLAETAIEECDRFYPAFQFALWGDRTPEDALAAAMVDAIGEA